MEPMARRTMRAALVDGSTLDRGTIAGFDAQDLPRSLRLGFVPGKQAVTLVRKHGPTGRMSGDLVIGLRVPSTLARR